MLHILLMIVLLILKIIGIILAAAIGILLLVLICGLFVPIRYYVMADGKLGEKHPVRVEMKATWLLHMVNIVFSYGESARLRIRVLCFTLLDSARERKRKKEKKEKKKRERNSDIKENGKGEREEREEIENLKTESREKKPETEEIEEIEETETDKAEVEIPALENEEKRNKSVFAFFHKLLEALKNIEYTIQGICGKIKNVMENIRYYIDILQGEAFRSVFRNAKKQLIWICRKVKPTKCRINLRAGMEDPATTGQIVAAYGILYPLVGGSVFLQPEFEEKVIEGDVYIKGKITGIIFLIAGLKIALDKNIWRLIKLLKKEGV